MKPYSPEIRFADIDVMGHVNNAVYLSYFEQARIHFFRELIGEKWDWRKAGILVAKNEINYLSPVYLNDHININLQISQIGNKSFSLIYELKREDTVCANGLTVVVCYDHETQQTIAIPEQLRKVLTEMLTQA
jgi:acyl-CoA thioester hydrolase